LISSSSQSIEYYISSGIGLMMKPENTEIRQNFTQEMKKKQKNSPIQIDIKKFMCITME
jgi:hypothetical protein